MVEHARRMKERAIRVLGDAVINQIAAGEVVDRPASVLKELVENAIDAGSAQVDVEIAAAGGKLVRVSDDGTGMSRDNALLSIERHATSKIREIADIERIATLGFRGEALAAISSVSRFTLRTRVRDSLAGTEITVFGGTVQDVRDAGCPPGTTVEVRNLFFNVPARRKFLRSDATEMSHLKQTFLMYALAHTEVGFSFASDGREIWKLAGKTTLEGRLQDFYRSGADARLCPVHYRVGDMVVSGHIGLPDRTRPDRAEQYIFINGRPASVPILHAAIREGYHSTLPRDRHPVVFLFLALDPGEVDVNVHPTKKEVRFRNPAAVRDAVSVAIRRALGGDTGALPKTPRAGLAEPGAAGRPQAVPQFIRGLDAAPPPSAPRYPASAAAAAKSAKSEVVPGGAAADEPAPERSPAPAKDAPPSPWAWHRVLGQVAGLYVVMEIEDGLVLMDPHAAHERILYERLLGQVRAGRVESQALLAPEAVDLNPADAERVRRALDLFKRLGFGVAEFGGDTFVVDALPACLSGTQPRVLLVEIAAGLEAAGDRGAAVGAVEEKIAQAACKAAVKARDRLSGDEIESIISQLARVEMPYTCPHGRPIIIHFSFKELDKRFGRTS